MKEFLTALSLCLLSLLGTAQYGPQQIIGDNFSGGYGIHAADLDNDGDKDILICTSSTGVWIYENLGGGNFEDFYSLSPFESGNFALTLDINNDGLLDIVVAGSQVLWYANNGDFTFGPSNAIDENFGSNISDCILSDLDGDGNLDIVLTRSLIDVVSWYENTGSGGFQAEQILSNGEGDFPSGVVAADFDGDGDSDLIFSCTGDDALFFKENLGGGNFGSAQMVNASDNLIINPRNLVVMDVNNDGDLDIITSRNGADIWWFENLGNNNFSESSYLNSVPVGDHSRYLFSDGDGDGDLDLLSIETSEGDLNLWENVQVGNGENNWDWNPTLIGSNITLIRDLAAYDLDGDGDEEVIVTYAGENNDSVLAWFENLSNPSNIASEEVIEFTLAPNPMRTHSTLSLKHSALIESASIYGTDGRLVYDYGILRSPVLQINKGTLASGMYLVKVKAVDGRFFVASLMVE